LKTTNEGRSQPAPGLQAPPAESLRKRGRSAIAVPSSRYVGLPRLGNCAFALSFLLARQPEPRTSAAPLCSRSCGSEASEPIPFPGANSIISSRCVAISGRLRLAVSHPRRATETQRRSATRSPRDGGVGTNIERLRDSGKKFVERLKN
jgi:hypothetical protein